MTLADPVLRCADLRASSLQRLARLYGLQVSYTDGRGQRRRASRDSVRSVLASLGAPIETAEDAAEATETRLRAQWARPVDPTVVAWQGRRGSFLLRAPEDGAQRVRCQLRCEDGSEQSWTVRVADTPIVDTETVAGCRYASRTVPLPAHLESGYHDLHIELGDKECRSVVIAAPPEAFDDGASGWGSFLPLYALRTERSWGVGSFGDFEALVEWLGSQGARTFSTLPLLSSFLGKTQFEPSPYLPVSRLFWNELYVDPRELPEFEHSDAARRLVASPAFEQQVTRLRTARLVDYREAMDLTRQVLELLAETLSGRRDKRHESFQDWVLRHPLASEYATFRARGERLGPRAPLAADARSRQRPSDSRVDQKATAYHLYAQWAAAEQIDRLSEYARRLGDGLYLDFPVGVHPDGFDAGRYASLFATDAALGAPPDALFTEGQSWSAPPPHPDTPREDGYRYLRASLKQQLSHAGTLRLDHVMGLHRLFWIPQGAPATDGVYVHYPADELYAIVCLESHRHRSRIVGENLGTVPAYVNTAMSRHKLAPLYVAQFGITRDEARPLRQVSRRAVASLNTHDTPTFAGFVEGRDIEELAARGVLDPDRATAERAQRHADVAALRRLGAQATSSVRRDQPPREILWACLEELARSAASFVIVNLEDLWLEPLPQNVPGTGQERDNWRRKARYALDAMRQRPEVTRAFELMRSGRERAGRRRGPMA